VDVDGCGVDFPVVDDAIGTGVEAVVAAFFPEVDVDVACVVVNLPVDDAIGTGVEAGVLAGLPVVDEATGEEGVEEGVEEVDGR